MNKLKGATDRSMERARLRKSPSRRNICLGVHESDIPVSETLASKVLIGSFVFFIARIILHISFINFAIDSYSFSLKKVEETAPYNPFFFLANAVSLNQTLSLPRDISSNQGN